MTEVLYLRGEPCVRCDEGLLQGGSGPGGPRRLCPDHFREAAAEYFARRGHADPALTAAAALSQGLRGVSLPAYEAGARERGCR
ncbi:hypothetical protein ABT052_17415 [Streptomyces sp. NPDC002766]|jgi:hypothetical protein|uniref:hypothetical protein n=1 Tax=unclassified Streptomyces TaxID=2593676 RepID=UPI00331E0C4F